MTFNELADYIETKLCRESVFEIDPAVEDEESTYIKFPAAIRGDHKKYNDRYSTMHVAYVERDMLGRVSYVRICDFEPTFDDNGILQSYDYCFLAITDSKLIDCDLQQIDKMIEHDIALAKALIKCREIDAQTKLIQEIEKL